MSTDRAAPSLWIGLLGPPQVTWGGAALPLARRRTRALLYHLAAARRPLPRVQIAALFWPDAAEATARRNLTRLLVLVQIDPVSPARH